MTNKDILNKSFADMSSAEKAEAVTLAKNLIDILAAKLTEAEKERFLNSYGVYNLPERIKKGGSKHGNNQF